VNLNGPCSESARPIGHRRALALFIAKPFIAKPFIAKPFIAKSMSGFAPKYCRGGSSPGLAYRPRGRWQQNWA
jgi:hypothetical protein